ncbi:MAG TPA: bifunctional adenosylcobinamide kinase/adenosylcobinamide-phosphate guanylyltransferase [Micromonosporaceae bacterium]|nr:bifunctional adenosylcobinamide kinase/adenosylcobinamide-phosphate guanylyltransferase [Micromonosporaceae bacterium]
MAVDGWNTILVLGGIRSGKSDFAASLLPDQVPVRCVLTTVTDGEIEQDRATRTFRQRPAWTVERSDRDPGQLVELINAATPDEALLIDDLSGWVSSLLDPARQPADNDAIIDELAAAIRDCPARLVLVSPEVGLAPSPVIPVVGHAYVDALGAANQAVARACDTVVLVMAGQPIRIKPSTAPPAPTPSPQATATPPTVLTPTLPAPAVTPERAPAADAASLTALDIRPNMDLPLPDETAATETLGRLPSLDFAGTGLGNLEPVVTFAAGTQGATIPSPWRAVRVLLLHGDHQGAASAGAVPGESRRRADQARVGEGPIARLVAEAGATLQVVETPASAPIEHGEALSLGEVDAALQAGWQLAEEAVNDGADLIVLASCGAGTDTAAAAVLAATSGAEPAAVLPRVHAPGGGIDDAAWMARCAAVRDALHRTRNSPRDAKDVLAELGGGTIATATGILLGAAARRTPVLLDGPVGVAAGLVSRDLAGQARHWCLLPDDGGHPAVRFAAEVLGLTPVFDLRLDLGEGMTALATLPMLRSAVGLAASVPIHPVLAGTAALDAGQPAEAEFVEPEPAGPGPTTTGGGTD